MSASSARREFLRFLAASPLAAQVMKVEPGPPPPVRAGASQAAPPGMTRPMSVSSLIMGVKKDQFGDSTGVLQLA